MECLDAASEVTFLQSQIAKTEPRVFGGVSALRRELRVVLLGLFLCTLLLEDGRQVIKDLRDIRADLQRAFVGFTRSFQIAQFLTNHSQIDVRLLAVRTDADCLCVSSCRFFLPAQLLIGYTQVEASLKMIRSRLDEFFTVAACRFEIFVRERARGQTFQSGLRIRPQLDQTFRVLTNGLDVLAGDTDGDQIDERLFGFIVRGENILVDLCRFVETPCQLQPNCLAEERRFISRSLGEHAVEIFEGGFGLLQMQLADRQSESRFGAIGARFENLREAVGCFLPAPQLFQADGQIELAGHVLGIEGKQLGIAFRGILVLLEFELDVAHCRAKLGSLTGVRDGALQLLQRFLALAFQVQ